MADDGCDVLGKVYLYIKYSDKNMETSFTDEQVKSLYGFAYAALPPGLLECFELRGLTEESLEERLVSNPHWRKRKKKEIAEVLESVDKKPKAQGEEEDEPVPWGCDYIIMLDEKDNRTADQMDLRPNGYSESVYFRDFPIRNHQVYLEIRRKRWLTPDGKSRVLDIQPIAAKGSRYTEDFALFLKVGYWIGG